MGRSIALSASQRYTASMADRPAVRLKMDRPANMHLLLAKEFAIRSVLSIKNDNRAKNRLALIIPAYNEEAVLEHTVHSAIAAGLDKKHIYIVDDCSSDKTSAIARRVVGNFNILRVERSGKSRAIYKLYTGLRLTQRYDWIHVADADGEFDKNYFAALFARLDLNNAAATGYVASLPGGIVSKYRAFEYTLGMDLTRRFQSLVGVITIVPGPTSIFRSDVFEKLEFAADVLCEDFDITLQIHRQKLGTIQFIPEAIARTQDPSTVHDFVRQITRWNRGVMQMLVKHKVGLNARKIDVYLSYQIMQNIMFFLMYFVWVPIISLATGNLAYLALSFLFDVMLLFSFVLFASVRSGRYDIVSAFPFIYALRFLALGVFIKSFVDVLLLGKHRVTSGTWETVGRRSNNGISA